MQFGLKACLTLPATSCDQPCLLQSQQPQAKLVIIQTPDHQTTHWVFLSEGKHSGFSSGLTATSPRPLWKLGFKTVLKKPVLSATEDTMVEITQTPEQQDKKTTFTGGCQGGSGAFSLENQEWP